MFCTNCGNKLDADLKTCSNCGTNVTTSNTLNETNTQRPQTQTVINDEPNTVINILSLCCIPLLGIILYFVWKDTQPIAAKSALKFSLIGIAIWVVINVFIFIISFFTTSFMTY